MTRDVEDLAAPWMPAEYWSQVLYDQVRSVDERYEPFRRDNPVAWCARDVETFSSQVIRFSTLRPPLEVDPPDHQVFRRVLNPYFEPARIAAMEDSVRGFVREMLVPYLRNEQSEFVKLTEALPARVLLMLLSFPDEDWQKVNDMTAVGFKDTVVATRNPVVRGAVGGTVRDYALEQVERRRRAPGEDLVSALLDAEVRGRRLSDEEVVGIVVMMITAGHYTTTSAMGNSVLRLARDASLQARLRADMSLVPQAIEEVLRVDSSQQSMPRVTTRDTELGGQLIPAGTNIEIVWGSANFDDASVERPREFDIDRTPNRHLAFGRGIHMYIGAPLARLEVRVLLEELLSQTSSFGLAGEVRRTPWPRYGVTQLPLELMAR